MLYVPNDSYACYIVYDSNTIRAYHTKPYNPGYNQQIQITYTDYYVNSHYMEKEGIQAFGYNTSLPNCLSSDKYTNNFYYRNDFPDILIIVLISSIFIIFVPLKILSRFFRRFQ